MPEGLPSGRLGEERADAQILNDFTDRIASLLQACSQFSGVTGDVMEKRQTLQVGRQFQSIHFRVDQQRAVSAQLSHELAKLE